MSLWGPFPNGIHSIELSLPPNPILCFITEEVHRHGRDTKTLPSVSSAVVQDSRSALPQGERWGHCAGVDGFIETGTVSLAPWS